MIHSRIIFFWQTGIPCNASQIIHYAAIRICMSWNISISPILVNILDIQIHLLL